MRRGNPLFLFAAPWIASLTLAMTAATTLPGMNISGILTANPDASKSAARNRAGKRT
jgi:hypothetical protein